MRITVFGATGGTGKRLVEQAIAEGNEVVEYVRNPSKLDMENEHLTVVQGELTDEELIDLINRNSE
jgi:putative NADH-flavin reductase